MRHGDLLSLAAGSLDDSDALGDSVLTLGHNFNDGTTALRGSHDDMLMEKIILEDMTNLITAGDDRARLLIVVRDEGVDAILVEVGQLNATGDED